MIRTSGTIRLVRRIKCLEEEEELYLSSYVVEMFIVVQYWSVCKQMRHLLIYFSIKYPKPQ